MYPYLRAARVLLAAGFREPLAIDEVGEIATRAWPSDLDFYPEVNNGRHLTVMDLGRIDFALRTGLLRTGHRRGWYLVVGGASVRFRHRLRALRRFTIRTRLLGHDGRWFYIHQTAEDQERTCSASLLRAGLRSATGLVAAPTVLAALGREDWAPDLPPWVEAWIEAERLRPWPPSLAAERPQPAAARGEGGNA